MIFAFRGFSIFRTQYLGLQIARGAMAVGSASIFIYAVSFVPLVDAIAVTFVALFMVTLIAMLVLRVSEGFRRWTAVAIGFVGVLIVTRLLPDRDWGVCILQYCSSLLPHFYSHFAKSYQGLWLGLIGL